MTITKPITRQSHLGTKFEGYIPICMFTVHCTGSHKTSLHYSCTQILLLLAFRDK